MSREQWKRKIFLNRSGAAVTFTLNNEKLLYSEVESIGAVCLTTKRRERKVSVGFKIYMKSGRVINCTKKVKSKYETVKGWFRESNVFVDEPTEYFKDNDVIELNKFHESLNKTFSKYNSRVPTLGLMK